MRRLLFLIPLGVLLGIIGWVVVARATSRSIDGIPCDFNEGSAYHVHAHLAIVVRGQSHTPPASVGIHPEHLCLYWLHTHDASGIIHIEAPHHISPTLGQFFAIWGQPLSRRQIARYSVGQGETVRVYVNHQRYRGTPDGISLGFHTTVTLEIGPPFVAPQPVVWHGL